MKNKKTLTVVITVLILLIAGSGGFLIYRQLNNDKSRETYSELAASYANVTEGTTAAADGGSGTSAPEPNPIDFQSLQNENSDIYSWIKVGGTNVDYPVLQSAENDNFYLDHGVDRAYSFAGAIYSQFCNKLDYSDRVTVLYGHNMADNSMFASLHRFEDADFFSEHKEMTIYTPDKRLGYEIVSAYVSDDSHIMNSFDFSDDAVYRGFLENVLSPHSIQSQVREGAALDVSDRIVILSTCLNAGEGRYLVVGKLVSETELSPAV